jgi:hypothetical protein
MQTWSRLGIAMRNMTKKGDLAYAPFSDGVPSEWPYLQKEYERGRWSQNIEKTRARDMKA